MTSPWLKIAACTLLSVLLYVSPTSFAQTPGVVNVFSIWVSLSLRGNSQQEIESQLRNMDPKTILEVKERLRQNVISNLKLRKIRARYYASRDKDDLQLVQSAIDTEIRFAGLQSDRQLVLMIKDTFGIHLEHF